ncbi:hypothetical protein [Labedaea rhizosphaerae]|uniref:Uncharacterized protein n=1 Tax=Labedaea rhizosphaerae TaxID=598644 RepID=A0A4R6SP59_LABRH|nr:hypothetical protein [Labedaea rhizosphaerae]TDQ05232.1 hypothetical protein EV186_1011200 [Labedaea rhizosphaerae]
MNDLETLLRKEFDEQARSVPDSAEPWRALQRRLARRRALLVGAAAAVLLVAVAIVVPLTRHQTPITPATAAPTKPSPTTVAPVFDHNHPVLLAEGGRDKAWAFMVGDRVICVAMTKGSAAVDPQKADCAPDAANDSSGPSPVRTRAIGPEDGPFGHFLLFVADEGVHDLSVRSGDGTAVTLRLLGTTRQRQFWVADFGGSHQGFGYDGIDAKGNHFSAIT